MKLIIALITLTLLSTYAVANCDSRSPVSSENTGPAIGQKVFLAMLEVCNSGDNLRFSEFQSSKIKLMMERIPENKKENMFQQYCDFTSQANKKLGSNPSSGVHTFEHEKHRKTNCGHKKSLWYIRTKENKLAFKIEVIIENGELKIDTH